LRPATRSWIVALLLIVFLAPIGWSIGRGIAPRLQSSGRVGAEIAVASGLLAVGYWAYRGHRSED
jgi:cbb3-type cytochrome oxidase subunit 3